MAQGCRTDFFFHLHFYHLGWGWLGRSGARALLVLCARARAKEYGQVAVKIEVQASSGNIIYRDNWEFSDRSKTCLKDLVLKLFQQGQGSVTKMRVEIGSQLR